MMGEGHYHCSLCLLPVNQIVVLKILWIYIRSGVLSPGGFKDDFFNLFITSETDDVTIYYTTDGSKPDESSNVYNFIAINTTY